MSIASGVVKIQLGDLDSQPITEEGREWMRKWALEYKGKTYQVVYREELDSLDLVQVLKEKH